MNTSPVAPSNVALLEALKFEKLRKSTAARLEACTLLKGIKLLKNREIFEKLLIPQVVPGGGPIGTNPKVRALFFLCLDSEVHAEILLLLGNNPEIFREEEFLIAFFERDLVSVLEGLANQSAFSRLCSSPARVEVWKILSRNSTIFSREDFRAALCALLGKVSALIYFCSDSAICPTFFKWLLEHSSWILGRPDFREAFSTVVPSPPREGVKTRALAKKKVADYQSPVFFLYRNLGTRIDFSKWLMGDIKNTFSREEFCKILLLPFPSKEGDENQRFLHVLCLGDSHSDPLLDWLLVGDGAVLQKEGIFAALCQSANCLGGRSLLSHVVLKATSHNLNAVLLRKAVELIARLLLFSKGKLQIQSLREATSLISITKSAYRHLEGCLKNVLNGGNLDGALREYWSEINQLIKADPTLSHGIRWLLSALDDRFGQLFFNRLAAKKVLSPEQDAGLLNLFLCAASPSSVSSPPGEKKEFFPVMPVEVWEGCALIFFRWRQIPTATPEIKTPAQSEL